MHDHCSYSVATALIAELYLHMVQLDLDAVILLHETFVTSLVITSMSARTTTCLKIFRGYILC